MVRFVVHNLGEHTIDSLVVDGPAKKVIMAMADMFLATYTGPTDVDLDYQFAQYIIELSYGQGRILEYSPPPPAEIH